MLRKLFLLLLVLTALWLIRESWYFALERRTLPVGTAIGGVPVAGLTLETAGEAVARAYGQPVQLHHPSDPAAEPIVLLPTQFEFQPDLRGMLAAVQAERNRLPRWQQFAGYLFRRPVQPIDVPLQATFDRDRVRRLVEAIAEERVIGPVSPALDPEQGVLVPGVAGYSADIEATADALIAALTRPDERRADLVELPVPAPELDADRFVALLEAYFAAWPHLTPSLFVRNLETGEEIAINADFAVSGNNIFKLAVLLEVMRAVELPLTRDLQQLFNQTALEQGDYSAGLLLDVVAGEDNAYLGSDIVTESLQRMGLVNSFIVTPWGEPARPGVQTRRTPANAVSPPGVDPDPGIQTTAEDIGTLLALIHACSEGRGALMLLYPETLTAEECRLVLDVMALNQRGPIIRYGVPEGMKVAHLHGWGHNVHGNVGIVYGPDFAWVIAIYLTQPGSDWLIADNSFPIMRAVSRFVYNYWHPDRPNLADPEERLQRDRESAESP
jgi:hypothetical protein